MKRLDVKAGETPWANFKAGSIQCAVGRTPWSAEDPPVRLPRHSKRFNQQTLERPGNCNLSPTRPPYCTLGPCLLVALAHLSSCGYIGDPLPPSLDIPIAISNLRATQISDKLLIHYTPPAQTTENLRLKSIEATELRVGPLGTGDFNIDQWAASAGRFEVPPAKEGAVELELPIKDWIGREVVVAVRVMSAKQRYSAWSNLAIAPIIAPLNPPSNFKAQSRADGVLLQWQTTEGAEYRIFRGPTTLASVTSGEYLDASTEFDKPYSYQVQTFRKLNEKQTAESLFSKPIEITPKDTFPPGAPTGLQLIQGVASIEIAWSRSSEPDLKSYKIWRADGDSGFTLLAEAITQTSHSDRTAARGKKYRYAITAIDNAGNESDKSQTQEFTLPE